MLVSVLSLLLGPLGLRAQRNPGQITGIESTAIGDTIHVVVSLDGEVAFGPVTRLTSPERVFIDLAGNLAPGFKKTKVESHSGFLHSMRIGAPERGKTRIVFDVAQPAEASASYSANPPRVVIDLSPIRSASAAPAAASAARPTPPPEPPGQPPANGASPTPSTEPPAQTPASGVSPTPPKEPPAQAPANGASPTPPTEPPAQTPASGVNPTTEPPAQTPERTVRDSGSDTTAVPVSAFPQQDLIQEIQIHGNRRIPADTIRARIFTKPGDVYDQAAIERDFNALWNAGYFQDIRFEREESAKGWIIHIYVTEKPVIRDISYVGLNSVSQSDVLDRFKDRKVSLTQESQYDPTKVKKAEVVIKDLLAEHGRQFATIRTEIRPIPPAAVGLTFIVKEGPKIKVGNIRFEGNKHISSRNLRRAMKNSHPIGIPHSIFLESIFHKTFNASKLSEDAERVRRAYQNKGYFKVIVQDPQTKIRDTGGGFRIPLIMGGKGKAVDITVPLEEGKQYRLKEIKFTGNKAITDAKALRRMFAIKDGDLFSFDAVAKGLEDLRKAYGQYGYINFTSVPDPQPDEEHQTITLVIDIDEGKPFYVRRIEFVGNTTTRDKVIRRELNLEEGQVYNTEMWKFSLLRLNQLQYFEQLDPEKDTETRLNQQEGTVDLTLKVKEKGKNSIGLTGGVSGLAGSFIGINYSTNNFLGLGETLTVTANFGNRQRELVFGFTEPYVFDRPLQLGFTVYNRRYNFDQAQNTQVLTGQQLNLPQNFLDLLQNFTQSSTGFTVSTSYPLHRSLKRVGLVYALDRSSTTVFSTASRQYFEQLNFRNISGPDALKGVVTSKVLPSFSFSTIDNPMRPHSGASFYLGGDISGLGGNVASVRPITEYKRFIPMKVFRPLAAKDVRDGAQTLGFRLQGSFITGYKGLVANPVERFWMGGDTDLRGFDIRAITPYAFLTQVIALPLTNRDGSLVPVDPNNARAGSVTVPLAVHSLVPVGGDTSGVANIEYRVPIAGPVAIAYFIDLGVNGIARTSQLQISNSQFSALSNGVFGCPVSTPTGCLGGLPFDQLVGPALSRELQPVAGSNWAPRMSTGLELQVIMPVINAPFRLYWAYNPLRLDTLAVTPVSFTRDMFPAGGAGDFTFRQAIQSFGSDWHLREPKKTFRFTVSTTF